MDVIYKVFLIWSVAHSTYQASNNFDHSLHLSQNLVKEKISTDEKASGRRLDGLLTKKCYGDGALSYEDTVCTKFCRGAWIHNYYTLAFWNSVIKGEVDSQCLLQNGKKDDVLHLHKHIQNKELGVTNDCNENNESGVPVSPVNLESSSPHSLYSSVWCYSSPESGLRCHFQNLHYNLLLKEYAFVYSPDSIVYGIKNIRDLQEQLYLSSVKGHNAFQMRIAVVPYTSFVTKYKSKIIHGKSLLMARFKPDNLMHVFHDDLLPIYFTIQELCTNIRSCIEDLKLIITDENERGMYWDLFQLLSKKIMLISEHVSNSHTWCCFESAFIGLNMISVWYQYGFGKPQGPEMKSTISGYLLRQFTGFVKKELKVPQLPNDALVGVLISRKFIRKILNENEVAAVIQDHLAVVSGQENSDVKILSLEENGLHVVIGELSRARVAVGMHGAALILGMFLPPGSLLIEIWPFGIDPSAATVYKTMCELEGFGVTYVPWVNKDSENTVFHPEYPTFYGGLSHLSYSEQEDTIRSLYENLIQDLECCDNSNWLFRVYQDTKVHISESGSNYKSVSFSSVLKEGLRMSEEYVISDEIARNRMQFQMYPSVVQEAKCYLIRNSYHTKMFLEWKDPWNTEDINCQDIFFEVVVQAHGDSKVIRNVLHDRRFLKKFNLEVESTDTWITCFCDDIEGAVQYVKCV
ncbi:protein O-linked-mannose beta-1,4-N-acetylglucosaminyltransferase 2-like isoform X1 [Panulirus ornatus]|uniref:protein O-linked-mannose beta-1,4-N-acetylglucosaminyltransferase 2-like isoform X1 n=1 Tax=Panulirus ornatus TaxID=150431 RepID=UPI003A8C03CC